MTNNPIKLIIVCGLVLVSFGFAAAFGLPGANIAFADEVKPSPIPCVPHLPCIQQETQTTSGGVYNYVVNVFGSDILKYFLGICAATAVIFLIIGGLQMHLALGNEEALKKAKATVTWAIVGLVIVILAAAIVQIVVTLPFTPPPPPPPPT